MDMSDMDMDMGDDSTSSMSMSMKMYFHGTLGDMLWFKTWVPTSSGAFAGACIGLFFLAVLDRFLAALRSGCEEGWKIQSNRFIDSYDFQCSSLGPNQTNPSPCDSSSASTAQDMVPGFTHASKHPTLLAKEEGITSSSSSSSQDPSAGVLALVSSRRRARWAPPFMWRIDLMRGVIQAAQTAIHYLLMLAIMTFNVYFFLVVILGVLFGEVLFGRYCYAASTTRHH